VGVAKGGGVDALPGKRFRETTNSSVISRMNLPPNLGDIFLRSYSFVFSLKRRKKEKKGHVKLLLVPTEKINLESKNVFSLETPDPSRAMALGRNLRAVAWF
jgi:hypothetical protein